MKTEYKAIMASFIVVALCFCAVGGVTYSWFSDTEETPINVNTATIDIATSFSDVDVDFTVNPTTPATPYDPTVYSTTASAGLPPNTLIISNMLANRTITATYTLDNNGSDVNSMYRLYIKQDTLPDTVLNAGLKVFVDNNQIVFKDGIGFVVGDKTSGVLLVPGHTEDFEVKIVADEHLSQLTSFTISMVAEAYQVDYKYTEPIIIKNNTATISQTSEPASLTFIGEVGDSVSTAGVSTPIEVTFPENVMETLLDVATGDITLTVTVDQRVDDSLVTLTLTGTTTDFYGDYVDIRVTLDGTIAEPIIRFNGDGEQPVTRNIEYSNGQTIVTFSTNHFSEFIIYDNSNVSATDVSTLIAAFETGAKKITLIEDTTYDLGANVLVVEKGKEITLDLNGGKIVASAPNTYTETANAIINYGKLIIQDSTDHGLIYTSDISKQGNVAVYSYGELAITGGTFGDSDTDRTNANHIQRGNALKVMDGTTAIIGGYFTACDNYTGEGNGYAYALGTAKATESTDPKLLIDDDAVVYGSMNGGLFADGGTVEVWGGTFTLTQGSQPIYYLIYVNDDATVTIFGGTFYKTGNLTQGYISATQEPMDIEGERKDGSILIYGGTFVKDDNTTDNVIKVADVASPVSKVVGEGFVCNVIEGDDDCWTKLEVLYPVLTYIQNDELVVGNDIFSALKNADEGSTIKVYQPIEYNTAPSTYTISKTITIEGVEGPYEFQPCITINNIPGSYTSGLGAYISTSAGTTTWKNIGFEFNFLADHWKNACLGARDAGSLVVDGCTFDGDYLQVAIGSNSNKTHTVNDCTFYNPGIGYYPRTGTLNITDNDFVGTKNGIVLEPMVGTPYGTVTITGNTFDMVTKTDLQPSAWTADHSGRSTGIAIYGSDNTWTTENLIISGNTFNDGSEDDDLPVVFATSGYVTDHTNYGSDTVNLVREIINNGNNTVYDGAIYAYRTSSTVPSPFVYVTLDTAAVVDPDQA